MIHRNICITCKKTFNLEDMHLQTRTNKSAYYRCKPCARQKYLDGADFIRLRASSNRKALKDKVIEYLGGKCIQCNNSDRRVLQLEHTNADGYKERTGGKATRLQKDILAGKRLDIQLLCANCHAIKSHDNKDYLNLAARERYLEIKA